MEFTRCEVDRFFFCEHPEPFVDAPTSSPVTTSTEEATATTTATTARTTATATTATTTKPTQTTQTTQTTQATETDESTTEIVTASWSTETSS